ncbi:hypothetical protein [Mangrovimonas aestuarii]|uniref:hypothetical protein n=1 Tax=Mangrovimonas aestuarii TaxID=3018443 RepID=UPI002379D240|nr:hypothetical protein [Mangrovimonas aestuarii]
MNDKSHSYFNEKNTKDVYFVGDSYASTNYVKESYPVIFKNYFKSIGWNFTDLSRAGTELNYHKPILDSLSDIKPELIIYYYNISDVVSLNDSILLLNDKNVSLQNKVVDKKERGNSLKRIMNRAYNDSETILLLKKIAQYSSLILTDRHLAGTPANKFPMENKRQEKKLKDFFSSITAENVIILINTPFYAGEKVKMWEQYNMFNNMETSDNCFLVQAVDIIDDSKYAVSWRNGHPNQEAIKVIADSLINKIEELRIKKQN